MRRPGVTWRTLPVATVDCYAARLVDHVGIPAILGSLTNVVQGRLADAAGISANTNLPGSGAVLLAASRGNGALTEARYNRVAVARLDHEVAVVLSGRVRQALDYLLSSGEGGWS